MLQKKAIVKVDYHQAEGFYNRLFVVEKASGGWRPVLDVSALNKYVLKTKFSMETPRTVIASLRPGDWMVSLDMQDAYFHIPIHQASQKYLRFVFQDQVYQFRSLPFGLCTAPQVFTRVLAPLAKWLHLMDINICLYLDDWLLRSTSKEQCVEDRDKTLRLAQELGLLINKNKSQLDPSQQRTYLGMTLDALTFRVFPSIKRVDSCLHLVQSFTQMDSCSVRDWMKLLGTLTSMEMFVSLGRLHLRVFQFYLKALWSRKTETEDVVIPISAEIKEDLKWWMVRERLLEGLDPRPQNPDLDFFADASDVGWGLTWNHKKRQANGLTKCYHHTST